MSMLDPNLMQASLQRTLLISYYYRFQAIATRVAYPEGLDKIE